MQSVWIEKWNRRQRALERRKRESAERSARKRAEAEANLKASLPRIVLQNDVVAVEAQTSTSNIAAQTSTSNIAAQTTTSDVVGAEAQTLTSTIVAVEAQISTSNIAAQTSTSHIVAVRPQKKNERREECLAQRCTSKDSTRARLRADDEGLQDNPGGKKTRSKGKQRAKPYPDIVAAETQTSTSTIVAVGAQTSTSNFVTVEAQASTSNIVVVRPQKKNERLEEFPTQRHTLKASTRARLEDQMRDEIARLTGNVPPRVDAIEIDLCTTSYD